MLLGGKIPPDAVGFTREWGGERGEGDRHEDPA
jgi:hypothetical protein